MICFMYPVIKKYEVRFIYARLVVLNMMIKNEFAKDRILKKPLDLKINVKSKSII